jgi:hypothetical protein
VSLPFEYDIFVIDTNAVIDIKKLPIQHQWPCCERLQELVEMWRLAFPRQVVKEIQDVAHPDLPGGWLVGKAAGAMKHDEPTEQTLADVQRRVGRMFDPDTDREPADPYVVAMAEQLRNDFRVTVVSRDRLPKRGIVSVHQVCEILQIPCIDLAALLEWAGFGA